MGQQSIHAGVSAEAKKIAISAVIRFNDAHNVSYRKLSLFEFFGVSKSTGFKWVAEGSLSTFQGGHNTPKTKEPKTDGINRSASDEEAERIASSPPPIRKNPVRNGGRGRERLKSLILEDMVDTDALSEVSAPATPRSTPPLSDGTLSDSPDAKQAEGRGSSRAEQEAGGDGGWRARRQAARNAARGGRH
jgi:hypothetical protein